MKNLGAFGTEYAQKYCFEKRHHDNTDQSDALYGLAYSLFFAFPLLYNKNESNLLVRENIKGIIDEALMASKTPDDIAKTCISMCKPYLYPENNNRAFDPGEFLNTDNRRDLRGFVTSKVFEDSLKRFLFISYWYNDSRSGEKVKIKDCIEYNLKVDNEIIIKKAQQALSNLLSSVRQMQKIRMDKAKEKNNKIRPFLTNLIFDFNKSTEAESTEAESTEAESTEDKSTKAKSTKAKKKSIRIESKYDFPFLCALLSSNDMKKNPFMYINLEEENNNANLEPFFKKFLTDRFFLPEMAVSIAKNPINAYLLERITNVNMINQFYQYAIKDQNDSIDYFRMDTDSEFYDVYKLFVNYPLVEARLDLLSFFYQEQLATFANYKEVPKIYNDQYVTWSKVIESQIFNLFPMITILFHVLMKLKILNDKANFTAEKCFESDIFTKITKLFNLRNKNEIVPQYNFPDTDSYKILYSALVNDTLKESYDYLYSTNNLELLQSFFDSLNSSDEILQPAESFNNYLRCLINKKL